MLVKRKIGELRVSELRSELEKRSLDSKGLKSTLLQRLQKAILDEGGDTDQIEVDVSTSASPISRKNSPRIKRGIELQVDHEESTVESTKVKKTTKEEKQEVLLSEKSALSSDADEGEIKGDPSTKSNEIPINNEENTEEEKENFTPSMESEGENNLQDKAADNQSVEADIRNNHETTDEEKLSQNEVQEIPEQSQESNENRIEDSIDSEKQPLDETESSVDDSDLATDNVKDETSEFNMALINVDIAGNEEDYPDDASQDPNENSEDAYQEREDSDIALEDDVLDMLDYDIEMPDHSQVDDEEESKINDGANEDGLTDQVAKASDENGNKESLVSSESVARKEGDKLFKNLWISGLSGSTRASELKAAFSRYGKVVGAKVVANARNPGARCYGFVVMASIAAAQKCIIHLHKTELEGHLITVESIKQDPSTRKTPRKKGGNKDESDDKTSQSSQVSSKDTSTSRRSVEKEMKESEGDQARTDSDPGGKFRSSDKRLHRSPLGERQRPLRRPFDSKRESSAEPYRKRPRPIGERKVMIDKRGGMSLRVNVRSTQDGRRDHVVRRVSRSPVRSLRTSRFEEHPRRMEGRGFPPEHIKTRDRDLRTRDVREEISRRKAAGESLRPARSMALQASIERDRMLLRKEREERNFLRMERERLERERRQLERDRIERERLEQERLKLEHERKRELEKIEREKAEMKRLQEINRYEQSQRQRALKRMYDGRPHDDRMEGKRLDRDDRRRYEGDSRDRSGAPIDLYYRDEEGGYRSRSGPGGARLDSRPEKMNYHDVDRRNMGHNDTDARYGPPSGGRRVEKYERPAMKSGFDHDRRNASDVGGNLSYRHHDKEVPDDRKVIPRDRSRPGAGSFRRDDMPMKKEGIRGGAGAGRPRPTDRDLREEIRQGPMSGGRKGSPHRGDLRHRDEPPPSRSGPRSSVESQKYPERNHPEPGMHGSGTPPGKPIPTTGKSGMNFEPSSAWPGWQDNELGTARIWHGPNPIPGSAPVGRMVAPIGIAFNPLSSVNPSAPIGADGGMITHNIPSSFAPRLDNNFKQARRF